MTALRHISLLLLLLAALSSCCDDYRRALPSGSVAVARLDATDTAAAKLLGGLGTLLGITDFSDSGIDMREPIYAFVSPDGSLGLCAKVSDDDAVEEKMQTLVDGGKSRVLGERRGIKFWAVGGRAVAGLTHEVMLVMGPVTAAGEGDIMQRMARLLSQSADESLMSDAIWERIDTISAPMAVVAEAAALPPTLRPLAMLGVPREADVSKCLISMTVSLNETLRITAEPFSTDSHLDKAIHEAYSRLRPISSRYSEALPTTALFTLQLNADGQQLLPLLAAREETAALLAALSSTIDGTAVLRSANGDIAIAISPVTEHRLTANSKMEDTSITSSFTDFKGNLGLSLAAELRDTRFMEEIDYWRSSLPRGYSLKPWRRGAYLITGGGSDLFFGTSDGTKPQFYAAPTAAEADSLLASHSSLSKEHPRLSVTINLSALGEKSPLASVLGVSKIEYIVK